ncbi:cellulose biosynthesis cyclic di-GMP-binding regulatory protein BcsB [Bordetella avium]|uniref:cellulose biosynthesis cyclic di-GMP-binding regulatory protein BcsB n=1 Tax=Bordetella avium TaxID=521 RepID=UPI0020135B16|nr:cellulose biosynthesis cyclic di-GMP-binding regulatory protein BcsB [Bordetella avium]
MMSETRVPRRRAPALLAALLSLCVVSARADTPPALPPGAYVDAIPLSSLSGQAALPMFGVEGATGLGFSPRRDQKVIGARVLLDYTYSPALLPDLSHLKVSLNGEVADTIALPKEASARPTQRTVDLPVQALKAFNRLDMQLIGHYTMGCEDPLHSSLWANVAGRSMLELTVVPADLPDDLALLPVPFFDSRDVRQLNLPLVLGQAPDGARLESAGIVASWFGAHAGYRGARFSSRVQALPEKGNAVVFLQQGDSVPGLPKQDIAGPSLAMVAHPQDPHGKLLLVMGRNAAELKQAATALALGAQALSGQFARITDWKAPQPRKPFDAPNWLPSDRPVQFGGLVPVSSLNVDGHRPPVIQLDLRMPPGLFGWHSPGVPVDLKYRYSPRPGSQQSVLEMMAGGQLVQSFSLNDGLGLYSRLTGIPVSEGQAQVMVPTYLLPPMSTLQFRYAYEYLKQGECQNSILNNIRSAIDPASTIDISGLPKYAAMPDLSLFAEAGFPFTRLADLSETAVIMPDQADGGDIDAYLDLMGLMGKATGYPVTGVTVAQAAKAQSLRDKDLLVLASGENQPLLSQWRADLPDGFGGGKGHVGVADWFSGVAAWFGADPRRRERQAEFDLAYAGGGAVGSLAGLQSPLRSGRSAVVVAGANPDGLAAAVSALTTRAAAAPDERQQRIGGNLTLINGAQIFTAQDDPTYYVGSLPPWLGLQWFFAGHPLVLVVALFLSALVIAVLVYLSLRARARRRLES